MSPILYGNNDWLGAHQLLAHHGPSVLLLPQHVRSQPQGEFGTLQSTGLCVYARTPHDRCLENCKKFVEKAHEVTPIAPIPLAKL
eukprot:865058-Pelagomonas_calceolata.AAC.4